VDISIKKQGAEAWPRLTAAQTKLSWLKIDFDKFLFDEDLETEDEQDKMAADEVMKNIEKQLQLESGTHFEKSVFSSLIILLSHNFGHFYKFVNFRMTSFTTYSRK